MGVGRVISGLLRHARRRSLGFAMIPALALVFSACIVPGPGTNDLVTSTFPESQPIPSSDYTTTPAPVQYGTDNGTALYAQVFTPTTPPPPGGFPVIVYFTGGGWMYQQTSTGLAGLTGPSYPLWIGQSIIAQVARGWVVVNAEYSTDVRYSSNGTSTTCNPGSTFPAALYDAKNAVRWVQGLNPPGSSPAPANVDKSNVVASGSSAGGTLAALVALTPGYFEPPGGTGKTTVKSAVTLDGPNSLINLDSTADTTDAGIQTPLAKGQCSSDPDNIFPSTGDMTGPDLVNLFLCGNANDSSCINNPVSTASGGDGQSLIQDASPFHWVNATSPSIYIACSTNSLWPNLGCNGLDTQSSGYELSSDAGPAGPAGPAGHDAPAMAYALVHDTHNDASSSYQGGGFLDQGDIAQNPNHFDIDQWLNFTYLNDFLDLPFTDSFIPSGSSTLTGEATFDAFAHGNDGKATDDNSLGNISKVEYVITGGSFEHQSVATATATIYGWVAQWNTTSVPNGTYTVQSVAQDPDGNIGISDGFQVTISN